MWRWRLVALLLQSVSPEQNPRHASVHACLRAAAADELKGYFCCRSSSAARRQESFQACLALRFRPTECWTCQRIRPQAVPGLRMWDCPSSTTTSNEESRNPASSCPQAWASGSQDAVSVFLHGRKATRGWFRLQIFATLATVALSFVFGNYCLIVD
jgi:hypothetical protein